MANENPIKHVVIIFKENHAFDTYFGTFAGAEGDATLEHASDPPTDKLPHDHGTWMNRADLAVRKEYAQPDIAAYFAYAQQFTLCDTYFTDVAGPSTPNHLMLIAADSPIIDNPHHRDPMETQPPYDLPSLPANLETAGLDWRNYGGYAFNFISALRGHRHTVKSERFVQDATAGNLPAVSWVYAPHLQSEHAPDSVTEGMAWTVDQINAIVQGGLWPSTAIVVTWDDWGGWSDHVDPPQVETYHDNGAHPEYDGDPFRYGSRVPCLVLSPYAKQGYISKTQHSHVSLVKFCETTFGLHPINDRDAAADDMSDCFDFAHEPAAAPPANPGAEVPVPPT